MLKCKNCSGLEYAPAAVLRVRGADAATFLQGQFTNELQKGVGAAVYGLWLNQKGKVVGDSHVLRLGADDFWVVSERTAATGLKQRLEEYIIADEVSIEDVTADYRAVAVWGAEAGALIAGLWGKAPSEGGFLKTDEGLIWAGGRADEWIWLGSQAAAVTEVARLRTAGVAWVGLAERELARIRASQPAVPVDIGPGDLPNEGGLEQTAISYTKGCYLGQEVMARLKNLGQVRRRLHVVRGAGEEPAPGTPLFQGDVKVGELRSVAREGEGFWAFAMLSLVTLNPALGLSLVADQPASVEIYRHD